MAAVALSTLVDLAAWDEHYADTELYHELVEGVPTPTPSESLANRYGSALLTGLLNDAGAGRWLAAPEVEVLLVGDPAPVVRRPDVVVVRGDAPRDQSRFSPADVLLVAEFVSPSSRERDLVA